MFAFMARPVRLGMLTVASILALLLATPVFAGQVKLDRAWGSGTRAPYCTSCAAPDFQFNASSNPDGTNAAGTFVINTFSGSFTATVTCLNVSGKTATLVGQVNTATGSFDGQQGWWFVGVVQDLGSPTRRHPSPDTMSTIVTATEADWNTAGATLDQLCADPFSVIDSTMHPLVSGDLAVIDR